MELSKFMDNIEFVFCDKDMNEECRELFIDALHQGIVVMHSHKEMNDIAQALADAINIAPLPILAKYLGTGVEFYYRSTYLLNFEYDNTYENWGFYIDLEDVTRDGMLCIPIILMLFYNVLVDIIDEYKEYPKVEQEK